MRRAAALIALLATGCMSMEPHYERPAPSVPGSWPVGDAYLRQSEATLPAAHRGRKGFRMNAGCGLPWL